MSAERDACFTLDDYIKKKKDEGSLCLLGLRKREKNIDKDKLDASLDDIMRKNAAKRGKKCGISKFDRFTDDSGNQSDDDDEDDEGSSGSNYRKNYNKINNDLELMDISENNNIQAENSSIRFAKEIQKMDHPECCRIKKHFTTVESSMGVKIKSQQWRVQNKNDNRSHRPVLNGRIQKNPKQNNAPKAGIFIEKGNFTYKFNDDPSNDSDDNADSIVGIVRNKPVTKIIRVGQNNSNNDMGNYSYNNNFRNNRKQNGNNGSSPVNINMNWNGFFKGMSECMKTVAAATQPLERKVNGASETQDIQVKIAASELLEYLKSKRDKPDQNVTFSQSPIPDPVNEYIVSATAGKGIDMDICPSVTNMPMNLRFA